MSRVVCLSLVVLGLAATPGCSSCFGGGGCRRPSFMEFRSPCRRQAEPWVMHDAPGCGPACGSVSAPACGPACGESFSPAIGAGPCCNESGMIISSPMSAPMSAPTTMPPVETVPAPAATPPGTFS